MNQSERTADRPAQRFAEIGALRSFVNEHVSVGMNKAEVEQFFNDAGWDWSYSAYASEAGGPAYLYMQRNKPSLFSFTQEDWQVVVAVSPGGQVTAVKVKKVLTGL